MLYQGNKPQDFCFKLVVYKYHGHTDSLDRCLLTGWWFEFIFSKSRFLPVNQNHNNLFTCKQT